PTLKQIFAETDIGRLLTPDPRSLLTPGIAGNSFLGATTGWLGGFGGPCSWVLASALIFHGQDLQHIFNGHISTVKHPRKSKFTFKSSLWTDQEKLRWIQFLSSYVFSQGKGNAVQNPGNKNWVIVYGLERLMGRNEENHFTIYDGVGTDKDRS